jgi:hypothetical protein
MQLINSCIISRDGTFTAVRIMIELLVCWHKRILYSLQQPDFTQPRNQQTAEVKQTTHFVSSG